MTHSRSYPVPSLVAHCLKLCDSSAGTNIDLFGVNMPGPAAEVCHQETCALVIRLAAVRRQENWPSPPSPSGPGLHRNSELEALAAATGSPTVLCALTSPPCPECNQRHAFDLATTPPAG